MTRSLAMTAAGTIVNGHGYYAVDFAAVPQQTQRCFRLGALLSVETLSRQERDAVEAGLQQLQGEEGRGG